MIPVLGGSSAFQQCSSLSSVTIGNSVTLPASLPSLGNFTFGYSGSLQRVGQTCAVKCCGFLASGSTNHSTGGFIHELIKMSAALGGKSDAGFKQNN